MNAIEKKIRATYSMPFRFGDGYVFDEQRGNAAVRSPIFAAYSHALACREDSIKRDLEEVRS